MSKSIFIKLLLLQVIFCVGWLTIPSVIKSFGEREEEAFPNHRIKNRQQEPRKPRTLTLTNPALAEPSQTQPAPQPALPNKTLTQPSLTNLTLTKPAMTQPPETTAAPTSLPQTQAASGSETPPVTVLTGTNQAASEPPSEQAHTSEKVSKATSLKWQSDAPKQEENDPDKFSSPYILPYNYSALCIDWREGRFKAAKSNKKPKLIVYWQWLNNFPNPPGGFADLCFRQTKGPCELTLKKNMHPQADAIIFHASRMESTEPPIPKKPGQIWIARALEAPAHWNPQFRSPGWRGVFNWTFTYRPDSEIFSPVGYLMRNPSPPKKNYEQIARAKTRSVAWFVSDCVTLSKREYYVERLRKYVDVDIFGECGTHVCPKTNLQKCFDMLNTKYRFYLSFENTFCPYYVTEKIFNKFGYIDKDEHVVPVVRGGFDYKKYFPDGTYIDAADFASPEDLGVYLKKFSDDVQGYAALLERKDHFMSSNCLRKEIWCRVCDMLHDDTIKPKVYDDLGAWWDELSCRNPIME